MMSESLQLHRQHHKISTLSERQDGASGTLVTRDAARVVGNPGDASRADLVDIGRLRERPGYSREVRSSSVVMTLSASGRAPIPLRRPSAVSSDDRAVTRSPFAAATAAMAR